MHPLRRGGDAWDVAGFLAGAECGDAEAGDVRSALIDLEKRQVAWLHDVTSVLHCIESILIYLHYAVLVICLQTKLHGAWFVVGVVITDADAGAGDVVLFVDAPMRNRGVIREHAGSGMGANEFGDFRFPSL